MSHPPDPKQRALHLLESLTQAHGAPGSEGQVRAIFRRELDGVGDLSADRFGNVFCATPGGGGAGPKILIAGHMDEVGFMVQNITADGFIQFAPLGGWWTHTLLAQRVRILTRDGGEVPGIISSKPPHFLSEDERAKVMKIENLFIDAGAADATELQERFGVRIGDPVVPDSAFSALANPDLLVSKAFDNRVGMALAIQAAEMLQHLEHPNTIIAAGTCQEEVGCRGAIAAAQRIQPDVALILEGPPADDTPGMPDVPQGKLGGGVQIRLMDPTAIMNRALVKFVTDTADECGIRYQVTVRRAGGTDAKSVQTAGDHGGVPCIVLGVPARYIHSHNSVLHIDDYLAALRLVVELGKRLDFAAAASLVDYLNEA
ncbi:MAG: M42 family metallopeptidase [Verrucomicrobiales bacterium]